jgi:hypothetical protein
MQEEGMDLEIIINPKNTDDGKAVIQVGYTRNVRASSDVWGNFRKP